MIDGKKLIEEIGEYTISVYGCDINDIIAFQTNNESEFTYIVQGICEAIYFIEEQPKVGEWIPCSERLPDDRDNRFYMCAVENHEEDPPMFCQYEEEYGFGFWNDIYDEHTLGFVDSEFKTNEELGYEKVVAWMPLPKPYRPEEESE